MKKKKPKNLCSCSPPIFSVKSAREFLMVSCCQVRFNLHVALQNVILLCKLSNDIHIICTPKIVRVAEGSYFMLMMIGVF